ncbi:uncharacterized protein LY89DRAFT_783263 [Mollisia scopiformis]|uniref:Uncharacterized protein n=1 Tax=Mollisia scopiformis TaxID=149040 RepID=A0A194X791_MOLSC|nr:uncharacterized protein LY89DRAFT_783263 [Mollisia scopiformis]KUJ16033.1 hypothetical protein LY89DRAFT_783263 [Mollisia scopiformis]
MDDLSSHASQLGISDSNSPQEPFDPRQIARLLSEYYELMARMRYFSPDLIKYPPHDPPIDVAFAQSLGLEPQVIELLQVLPYVEGLHNEDEFILGGSFADFRKNRVLEQSRDPDFACPQGDYEEENGKYVMPWVLVLNECGNHGSIMYFDTRNGHITTIWQGGAGGGNADPYFYGKFGWSTALEHEHPVNKNRIEHFPSRPAKDLFADYTNRLMTLEWIPFNTYGPRIFEKSAKEEYVDLKLLFETYGWPGELDAKGFDAASRRWKEFNRIRREATKLMTEVQDLEKQSLKLQKHIEKTLQSKDEDVTRTPEEIATMEQHLQAWRRNLEWVAIQKQEAVEEAEGVNSEDSALEKAWEKHIQNGIERKMRDLSWFRNDGSKYATEEKMRDLEVGIAALEERMKDLKSLPKIAFDAIKSQEDEGQWLCCR